MRYNKIDIATPTSGFFLEKNIVRGKLLQPLQFYVYMVYVCLIPCNHNELVIGLAGSGKSTLMYASPCPESSQIYWKLRKAELKQVL